MKNLISSEDGAKMSDLDSDHESMDIGKCCMCKNECNPLSQTCGRCARSWFNPYWTEPVHEDPDPANPDPANPDPAPVNPDLYALLDNINKELHNIKEILNNNNSATKQ